MSTAVVVTARGFLAGSSVKVIFTPAQIRHPEVLAFRRASKNERPHRLMGAFVYMLRCRDGSYYVGSATGKDLSKRIHEHQSGIFSGYTSSRLPVELVWSEHFERITDAITSERKLKGWNRLKKEALIRGDWDQVKILAKRPNARS